jgi:hypothetical protein
MGKWRLRVHGRTAGRRASLPATDIGDAGLETSSHLQWLTELDVRQRKVSEAGEKFATARPQCKIVSDSGDPGVR